MLRLLISALAAAAFAALPSGLAAQSPVETEAGAAWLHEGSGITLPAEAGGLRRHNVSDFMGGEANVVAQYPASGPGAGATLYIYRVWGGDVPLHFTSAQYSAVLLRQRRQGQLKEVVPATAFGVPGTDTLAGLYVVHRMAGEDRFTGIAMTRVGSWIVKLRYTDRAASAAELAASMMELLGAVEWPEPLQPVPTPQPTQACENDLADFDRAEPLPGDIQTALIAATGGGTLAEDPAQARYCLLPVTMQGSPIFLVNDDPQRYIVAVGDAGTLLSSGVPPILDRVRGELAEKATERDAPAAAQLLHNARYLVFLSDSTALRGFGMFNELPAPEQAIAAVRTQRPMFVRTADEEGNVTISINPDLGGDEI